MKVLVTGSSGFVGGRFVSDFGSQYEIKTASLRATPISDISLDKIDVVVHCAALVHQMQGASREEYFTANYQLTVALAQKAKQAGVKQFIFLSTAHVYGIYGDIENPQTVLTTETPCNPQDPYGESKLAAEKDLQALQTANFIVSIVRPPLVYGEGAKGNLLSLAKLVQRMPWLPFKYDRNRRSIIYVGNLTYFIHLVIQKQIFGIFLPQDQKPLSIKDMITLLAQSMNRDVWLFTPPQLLLFFLKKALPHYSSRLFGSLALDSTESNSKLGYRPPFTTTVGMMRMIEIENHKE